MKHGSHQDAPLHGNSAVGAQTERGNQRSTMTGSASGRYPESSGGAFRAAPSPSPSMSDKGNIAKQGTVGSTRKDTAGGVMSHNPYPNGIA
jgi:hypothetical protein